MVSVGNHLKIFDSRYKQRSKTHILVLHLAHVIQSLGLRSMKALVPFTIFFVTIDIFLHGVSSISTLDNETYDVFVQLIKGDFAVPVKSRTKKQKSAVVRFWRKRGKLSLKGGMLCFNGKRVVTRETFTML